ncbi:HAD hydrolase-like protein [Oligoflexaceae bacterium]|nr:HAD hydrolase-like protein [Oligoflexaceae bacterium]
MQWILFDIDGTLLNSSGAGGRAMYAAVNKVFGSELKLGSVPFHGRTDRSIITDILKLNDIECDDKTFSDVAEVYLEHLAEELATAENKVFPGVMDLLKDLTKFSDLRIGILTGNMKAGAELKLKYFEIEDHFELGFYGDHFPTRNLLSQSARDFISEKDGGKFVASDIWIIGDTPADIECGRHIGAQVLAVSTGGSSYPELEKHKPDILVESLEDSKEFLSLLA